MSSMFRLVAAISRKSTRSGPRAPQSLDLALLESAQQLRLQLERHVADLVEKQRALVRQLEPADLLREGARERPLLVAEPLALEQPRRRGGAVHRHERPAPALARRVNGPRDQLLARAGLAEQQDRGVRRGDGV